MNVNEKLATATPTPPHQPTQTKYGWYPCSYETHQKLRLLNYLWLVARKRQAAWDRYHAKDPKNRLIRKQNGMILATPLPMPEPREPLLFWRNAEKKDAWMIEHDHATIKGLGPCYAKESLSTLKTSPARIDELIQVALAKLNEGMKVAV